MEKPQYCLTFSLLVMFFCLLGSLEAKECIYLKQQGEMWLNCSHLGLVDVPQSVSEDTTELTLSHNLISRIQSNAFWNQKSLKYLDISFNRIDQLSVLSFEGLLNLQTLNISNNHLSTITSFPKGVFKPLKSLLELDIRYNPKTRRGLDDYPDQVGELVSLNILRLDCVNSKAFRFQLYYMKTFWGENGQHLFVSDLRKFALWFVFAKRLKRLCQSAGMRA